MLSMGRVTAEAMPVAMRRARGSTQLHSPKRVKRPYLK
jgi:hypothetical protein